MIKINFLSSFKDAGGGVQGVALFDEDERRAIMIAIAKRLAILAIGPVALYVYEMQTIPVLEENKRQAENQLNELRLFNQSKQGSAEEIKRYEDELAKFNAQGDFINKIQADKLNEYKLFSHLKQSTPNTVWIDTLTLTENVLQISGRSTDANDITEFQEKLSNSDFIVSLVPLEQKTLDNAFETGASVTVFQVKATLKTGGK
ncbi:MAG: fimbrial assembly rane protein [Pseudobdellovibrio sp.]|nr:fimbrial assembly rane protein [Pseudobdellovibrio sp.]